MFEKVALVILSVVFILGGVMYILWGGPEGEVLPIPQIRASLGYRLLLGSACIGAGVVALLEFRRKSKNTSNANNNAKP
jgi:hypothetical protein